MVLSIMVGFSVVSTVVPPEKQKSNMQKWEKWRIVENMQ